MSKNPEPSIRPIGGCYSTMKMYGVDGNFRDTIIAPTPVTMQPQLFNYIKAPTNMPANLVYSAPSSFAAARFAGAGSDGCAKYTAYRNLGNICQ
jgi:hypothetical protein